MIERLVKSVGNKIESLLKYIFSVIDATELTLWNKANITFHILSRIAKATVYPVSVCFGNSVEAMVVQGSKQLYVDAWYDDNKAIKSMFKQGYIPIVKPNKNRYRGYYRHKARKLYSKLINKIKYKQRGRGESVFGSLTNEFGDRLKTSRIDTSITRIGARIIVYLTKIYMRIEKVVYGIVRHAHLNVNFKYFSVL